MISTKLPIPAPHSKPPWTDEEVKNLNEFQMSGGMHPFTCGSGNRSDATHSKRKDMLQHHDWGILLATKSGWVCPACHYTQDWAHEGMVDGSWVEALKEQAKVIEEMLKK